MAENVLIVHGGGPTAVINSSLYGVIEEAKKIGTIDKVYAAIGGSEGILKERFLDLLEFPEEKLKLLLDRPGMRWSRKITRPWSPFLRSMRLSMCC